MTNYEALYAEGRKVTVVGYRGKRTGTVVGREWGGNRRGGKRALYVKVKVDQEIDRRVWVDGIVSYRAKYLRFIDQPNEKG